MAGENVGTVDVTEQPLPRLTQLKQDLDGQIDLYGTTLQQLKITEKKLDDSRECVEKTLEMKEGKTLLVPLTTDSMYAAGHLDDTKKVLIGIETGDYVEKSRDKYRNPPAPLGYNCQLQLEEDSTVMDMAFRLGMKDLCLNIPDEDYSDLSDFIILSSDEEGGKKKRKSKRRSKKSSPKPSDEKKDSRHCSPELKKRDRYDSDSASDSSMNSSKKSHYPQEEDWEEPSHVFGVYHCDNCKKTEGTMPSKIKYIAQPGARAKLMDKLRAIDGPIVGLQHIRETLNHLNNETYQCFLCGSSLTMSGIIPHLLSQKHRLKFLQKILTNHSDLKILENMNANDQAVCSIVEDICTRIDEKFGPGPEVFVAKSNLPC